MYTREQYLEGIRQAEARNACKFNLNKAKEFFEAGDFEALHRIVVGNQAWLREQEIISEPLSGTGDCFYDNGNIFSRGTYVDGEEHGVWEWFHDNGQRCQSCTYVNGISHGVFETFHSNGKLNSRGTFEHGLHHGVWEWFHENGQPSSIGTLVNGYKHGAWEYFLDNGQLWAHGTYEHGELIKTETF